MKMSVISFTKSGTELGRQVAKLFPEWEISRYTKCSYVEEEDGLHLVTNGLQEWTKEQMEVPQVLLFIGACGIAVRAIAPYVKSKLEDNPILVMDEDGRFVIPILSGHVGGANELAVKLAQRLGACPVITTATDIKGRFAVDLFAKKHQLFIQNKEGIARISSKILAGLPVNLWVEEGHLGMVRELPDGINLEKHSAEEADILITDQKEGCPGKQLILRPKCYVLGIGCRKDKPLEELEPWITECLKNCRIMEGQIRGLASIDRKKEEACLQKWSEKRSLPFLTFSADELEAVEGEFQESTFVQEQVGVGNVCERAALALAGTGSKLVLKKQKGNGMTLAIAKQDWRIDIDET